RGLVAIASGAMLGMAGAILQSILHNPLADSTLTGVTAGAVFLVILCLAFRIDFNRPGLVLPLVALIGGTMSSLLVYQLAHIAGAPTDPVRLALVGLLFNAIFSSLTILLVIWRGVDFGGVLGWIVGSLSGRSWFHWNAVWPWALIGLLLGLVSVRIANVLSLGNEIALGLGLRTEQARLGLLLIAALLTGGSVLGVGALGFVGLIGAHIARQLVGNDARRLFPASSLCAAGLVLGADMLAQMITIYQPFQYTTIPTGIPTGAITAMLGAGFFLYLIGRQPQTG
ncbi:MAG: iron ABC transporter permease, partial [Chloroflexales bacterium]|nr:iron ABC transporter permease [Chloroflexales bacterium]